VRGELRDVVHNAFNCSVARGVFFDGDEAYVVEVYDGGKTDELGVKLYGGEEELTGLVYNKPEFHGSGVNETLSMTDEEAELPEKDREIEALARYVLQEGPEHGIEYTGPRELEDLNY
jgi:hypothetical protein